MFSVPVLSRAAAVALICAFAGVAFAQAPKFDTFDAAQKAALTSGKPLFVVSYVGSPGQSNALGAFTEELKGDAALTKSLSGFQLACVDLFSIAAAETNKGINPVLQEKFGYPCTVNVYAPGGSKQLWRKQLGYDYVMQATEHPKTEISGAIDEGVKAWDDFNKSINDLMKQAKDDKALKADAEWQIKLGDAWAKGFSLNNARNAYNEAIKLARKVDKADSRIETLSLRVAELEFENEAWTDSAKSFGDFVSKFKTSTSVNHAKIMQYRAMAHGGDANGAKANLELLQRDKKATDCQEEVSKALEEVEALAKAGKKGGGGGR